MVFINLGGILKPSAIKQHACSKLQTHRDSGATGNTRRREHQGEMLGQDDPPRSSWPLSAESSDTSCSSVHFVTVCQVQEAQCLRHGLHTQLDTKRHQNRRHQKKRHLSTGTRRLSRLQTLGVTYKNAQEMARKFGSWSELEQKTKEKRKRCLLSTRARQGGKKKGNLAFPLDEHRSQADLLARRPRTRPKKKESPKTPQRLALSCAKRTTREEEHLKN